MRRVTGLFYLIPNRQTAIAEWEALQLPHAFGGETPVIAQISALTGPSLGGTVYHADGDDPMRQPLEWYDAGEFWVGYAKDNPPGPEQLSRGTILVDRGWQEVTLEDGNDWVVPRLVACRERDPNRVIGVPCVWQGDADGPVSKPSREFRAAVKLAEDVRAACLAGEDVGTRRAAQAVAAALSVCYAVDLDEIYALGLLSEASAWAVLIHSLDLLESAAAGLLGDASPDVLDTADRLNEVDELKARITELSVGVV